MEARARAVEFCGHSLKAWLQFVTSIGPIGYFWASFINYY
jgi:hypothetical protein